jgi:hypothetical protein
MTDLQSRSNTVSRRHALIAAGILGLGGALVTLPGQARAQADDSGYLAPGLAVETLCAGETEAFTGRSLVMRRLTLQPGTILPPHAFPGPIALFVTSGVFGTELHSGRGTVTQASTDTMWDVRREMMSGEEVTMYGGDHIFLDRSVQTMWNDGDESVVLLVSGLLKTGARDFLWLNSD